MQQPAHPDLVVVMPVYNEQASIRKVVKEWFEEIEGWTENFIFLVINDGSKDNTLLLLQRLQAQLGPQLEIIDQTNRGHGQSCLEGYRLAAARNAPYILQLDSDGQCDPQYFFKFWREREKYDVIYGKRVKRDDGIQRTFASLVLRGFLGLFFRVNCVDANCPYRIMRTEKVMHWVNAIPQTLSLANIALAVLLRKQASEIRHASIPIRFRQRYGGEPTVKFTRFGNMALELFRQLKGMMASHS